MGASKKGRRKKKKNKAQKSEEVQVEFKPRPKWTDRRDNTRQAGVLFTVLLPILL